MTITSAKQNKRERQRKKRFNFSTWIPIHTLFLLFSFISLFCLFQSDWCIYDSVWCAWGNYSYSTHAYNKQSRRNLTYELTSMCLLLLASDVRASYYIVTRCVVIATATATATAMTMIITMISMICSRRRAPQRDTLREDG